MKTGRLLKFRVAAGDVQAYLYRDAGQYHAAIYLDAERSATPSQTLHGASEEEVESAVRSWVARNQSGQP